MTNKRITLIGNDSTHSIAFAKVIQDMDSSWKIKYCIKDNRSIIPISILRREQIESELQKKYYIEVIDGITDRVIQETDAFIITSVDASLHLDQFKQISKLNKPVFIDKPLSYSISDAIEINEISKVNNLPYFSCSSLRFSSSVLNCAKNISLDEQWEAKLNGPLPFQYGIPEMHWYGIHLIEALLTIFPEKFEVEKYTNDEGNIFIKMFSENCKCIIEGNRDYSSPFSGRIYKKNNEISFNTNNDNHPLYYYLVKEMLEFFSSKIPPISFEQTNDILTLLDEINAFTHTNSLNKED